MKSVSFPRLNGMVKNSLGNKYYYEDGRLHRIDGPAIEYSNGHNVWYHKGKHFKVKSQKEFEQYLKLKAFW